MDEMLIKGWNANRKAEQIKRNMERKNTCYKLTKEVGK